MPALRADAWVVPAIKLVVMLLLVALGVAPAISGSRLPFAKTAAAVKPGPLRVGVDQHGHVWIPGPRSPGPVRESDLHARLRSEYAARAGEPRVLHLVADRFTPYARVEAVLRAARAAGVRDVELIADCPRGTESLLRACGT